MLKYKGYIAHIQFDSDAEIFHGEVINIKDVVNFKGKSISELKKPFSGKFNVRIYTEVHRDTVIAAKKSGVSLNT